MQYLVTAWPILSLLLPALVLLSAVYFLVRGDRRGFAQLMALVACFLIGALLMEFFMFIGARMAPPGRAQTVPALGTGTLELLRTMGSARSVAAKPGSLAAVAAYGVLAAYLWMLVAWTMHLRGGGGTATRKKAKPAKGGRKPARA